MLNMCARTSVCNSSQMRCSNIARMIKSDIAIPLRHTIYHLPIDSSKRAVQDYSIDPVLNPHAISSCGPCVYQHESASEADLPPT